MSYTRKTSQRDARAELSGLDQYLPGVGLAKYPTSRTQADIKLQQNWCPNCPARLVAEGFVKITPRTQKSGCRKCGNH